MSADLERLAVELSTYQPPDVPLRLRRDGKGSRSGLVDYVREVIEQRTTVNDDTTADRLARGIVTSILSRLGAGYSIAIGSASVALVPSASAIERLDGEGLPEDPNSPATHDLRR